jgi:hypothetical protein
MGKFEPDKVRECLGLKEIFSIYEAGKTRRYGLLFTLNGAAFTLASYLLKDTPTNLRPIVPGVAIGMVLLTLILCVDIYGFGKKMADASGPLDLFTCRGRAALAMLGSVLIVGWASLAYFAWPHP